MLSVRSLAKIASRKKSKDGTGTVTTAVTGGTRLRSPFSCASGLLSGRRFSSTPRGIDDPLAASPPAKSVARRTSSKERARAADVPPPDAPLEAEEAVATEDLEETQCRIPSPSEVLTGCGRCFSDAKRQGVGELLVAIVAGYAAVVSTRYMLNYLTAVLELETPKLDDAMDVFWAYYEDHPVLCLSLNFGIAFAIGAAYLYVDTFKTCFRRLRERMVHMSRYGYRGDFVRLEEEKKVFFSSLEFSKDSGVHRGMSYLDAFAAIDNDGGGSISIAELKEALTKGNTELAEEDIEQGISQVDANGDGELQLDEFKTFWHLLQADKPRSQGRGASMVASSVEYQMVDVADVETGLPEARSASQPEPVVPRLKSDDELEPTEEDLKHEFCIMTEQAEELEVQYKVNHRKNPHTAEARTALEDLKRIQKRCQSLKIGMGAMGRAPTVAPVAAQTVEQEQVDLEAVETAQAPGFFTRLMRSPVLQMVLRSSNGIFSVTIYFADLISDVQVSVLLWTTGNYTWASICIFLLGFQFLVVELRVLPYLWSTFGPTSRLYLFFLFLGFPLGLLGLDALMVCEPFGLLSILPFPEWVRQFVPAYKATRIIAEVVIESLPQCALQSYIYVVVIFRSKAGTATASELAMLDFASVLPLSILISTIAMLKLWFEVLHGARAAGLTISAKAVQLWQVGAGLPLDALKKGTIVHWRCPYHLEGPEVVPLLDALSRNSSLVSLDLTQSGLTWIGAGATGLPLLEHMSQSEAVLSSLTHLKISPTSQCTIPVASLRKRGDEAMKALMDCPFFTPSGPRREEILFICDMLRRNADVTRVEVSEQLARDRVVSICTAAKVGKLHKDAWQQQLYSLIVGGNCRRGHLACLITADILHDVGFTASELLSTGFMLAELRLGGFKADGLRQAGRKAAELKSANFSAAELREGNFSAKDLRAAGFTPRELGEGGFPCKVMKEIGISAEELKDNGFTASDLKEGTFVLQILKPHYSAAELKDALFTAKEMREAGFQLEELVAGGFPPIELRSANYYCSEMRAVGFTIADLRSAGYGGSEMRIAGFTALEMKDAGFSAKKLKGAGYVAAEVMSAGWSIEVLKGAGYEAGELRRAGSSASQLRAVGFELPELRAAGCTTQELQDSGYGAEELRSAGVSLNELAMAGASVSQLKAAGISVIGMKAEGMPLKDLKAAGFLLSELKGAGYTTVELRTVGFDANSMAGVGVGLPELRASGYSSTELFAAGFSVQDLMSAGFTATTLKRSAFSAESLLSGGFTCMQLKDAGFSALELKSAGVSLTDLRLAGFTVLLLKEAGFNCTQMLSAGFRAKALYANGDAFSPQELKDAGVTAKVLASANIEIDTLVNIGFIAADLTSAGFKVVHLRERNYRANHLLQLGYTLQELKSGGYSVKSLRAVPCTTVDLLRAGFSFDELKDGGCTAEELKEVGATVKDLKSIGFTVGDLLKTKFTILQLRSSRFPVEEFRKAHVTAKLMQQAGCSAKEMRDGGYTLAELLKLPDVRCATAFSIKEMKAGGVPLQELKNDFDIKDLAQHFPVEEIRMIGTKLIKLKQAGFTALQLKEGGYQAADFHAAQYSCAELKEAGFQVAELKLGGYVAHELKQAGFGVAEMRGAGFTAKEMQIARWQPADLRLGGYRPDEIAQANYLLTDLRAAGIPVVTLRQVASVERLMEVGFSVSELRSGGCSVEELVELGVQAGDLYRGGFRVRELRAANFTAAQLRDAGINVRELRVAGRFSPLDLHAVGVTISELWEGGYALTQLQQVGYTVADYRSAGFAADALEDVGFTATALRGCGFTIQELAECTFSIEQLRAAGYTAKELHNTMGITAKELKQGGYTQTEIKAAGFKPWTLRLIGF